ncbi:hypothetical protein AbraIFM66950_004575 [Aspergillus brasiliensis]|nr:hypothetical protein AbraIFM66950_004575 [Aspergillus brasiliensis]
MDQPSIANWFQSPQGGDYPQDIYRQSIAWRKCVLIIMHPGGETQMVAKGQITLDSQQPFISICLETKDKGQIIFPFQGIFLGCGVENDTLDTPSFISAMRRKHSLLSGLGRVYYYALRCKNAPVFTKALKPLTSVQTEENWRTLKNVDWSECDLSILFTYKDSYQMVPAAMDWAMQLHTLVHDGPQGGKGFWYYRQNPESDVTKCHPEIPWLWSKEERNREYKKWNPHTPVFFDDNDRVCRLLTASKNERYEQQRAIHQIYNPTRRHEAWCTESDVGLPNSTHLVHIKLKVAGPNDDGGVVPRLVQGTKVHFEFALEDTRYTMETKLAEQGVVVECDSRADIVLRVTGPVPEFARVRSAIVTSAKAHMMRIDAQITALDEASRVVVFGDSPGNAGQGFSLRRTLLAHGTELEVGNQGHFTFDVRNISTVPAELQQQRLQHICNAFPLDETQRKAFIASLLEVICGISLIQGPPGTGKTSTAKAVVCAVAALGCKVLLVAGSNRGVDNLAEAVMKAHDQDERLRAWCGQLVRFRTPRYQLDRARGGESSNEGDHLRYAQAHVLALKYAKEHAASDKHAQSLLERLATDKQRRLSREERKGLKGDFEWCVMKVLEKANIVATTLSNASSDILRGSSFKPDFVICDEAGQCQEGEVTIALTIPTVRAVVLIGDPKQLPPTVLSEYATNEGALYLKRSLMERLYDAGYPCTMLMTNYRNHSQILDLLNSKIYCNKLRLGPSNDSEQRVGKVWDTFTRSRHFFRGLGVVGVRRLFISVTGIARRVNGSRSWSNQSQGLVAVQLLKHLYGFRTNNGQSIGPEDVMIISPYMDQRALVGRLMDEYGVSCRDNLTMEAAQGQEAPVVIFMLTKPSEDASSVGFITDQHRLNVVLSRAQQVFVIIGNLDVWNKDGIQEIMKTQGRRGRLLVDLLYDVTSKAHTMAWYGEPTVEEEEPTQPVTYCCPDRVIRHPPLTVGFPSAPAPQQPPQASRASFSTAPWRRSVRAVPEIEEPETSSQPRPCIGLPFSSLQERPRARHPPPTSRSRDSEGDVNMEIMENPVGQETLQQTGCPPSPVRPLPRTRRGIHSPPPRERSRSPARAINNRLLRWGNLPQVGLVPRGNLESIPVEELESQLRISVAAENMAAATLRRTMIEEALRRVRRDGGGRNDRRDGR